MPADLVIRGGAIGGRLGDVHCSGGRIVEIGPSLACPAGGEEIDAEGGEVIRGLADHHIHLRALAAAGESVAAGPPLVTGPGQLGASLAEEAGRLAPGAWIRAVGYHESVAGLLDAATLDAYAAEHPILAGHPVRVQHRGGSLWVLNSAAMSLLGVGACPHPGVERDGLGRPTGRLWRMDGWIRARVPSRPNDLGGVSRAAASMGITGFTDATAGRSQADADELVAASDDGVILQRLCLMTPPGVGLQAKGAHGRAELSRIELGPVKILLDDTTLPTLEALAEEIGRARSEGRAVAVHCVTRVQLVLTLAALEVAGSHPGDRIEHGALIGEDQFAVLRDRGLVVVTQPGLIATRGDQYARDVDARDQPDLWRLGSLCRAGIRVALGSDAPFGPADPWVTVRAAQDRTTAGGLVLAPSERIGREGALRHMAGLLTRPGWPVPLAVGTPADLCVLQDGSVRHTVVGGTLIFTR